jgi:hypothetical protein
MTPVSVKRSTRTTFASLPGRPGKSKTYRAIRYELAGAAKNKVSHPTSVYLREEQLLLTSSYGLNDFALNLVYAHLFPHFILPRTAQARCGTTATARSSSAPRSALKTPRQQPAVVVLRPSHPKIRQSVANI